jgi:hypothetical protein
MTGYREFLDNVMSHDQHGAPLGQVTADVCGNMVDLPKMVRLTGGDPGNIDGAIDAQLDRVIAACGGDMRLALFNLAVTAGNALTLLLGPRS